MEAMCYAAGAFTMARIVYLLAISTLLAAPISGGTPDRDADCADQPCDQTLSGPIRSAIRLILIQFCEYLQASSWRPLLPPALPPPLQWARTATATRLARRSL